MAWPAIVGPVISALASLRGGRKSNEENARIARENLAAQKEFAQHGVRWRVEDAKAAGLHPLYALGAQIPSYSPSFQVDSMGPAIAEAGQHIGRAVSSIETKSERAANQLQLEVLKKQLEESDARIGLMWSEAARNWQSGDGGVGQPAFPIVNEDEASAVMRGQVQVVPSQVGTASMDDPSVGAGENYAWRRYKVAPDFSLLLPGGPQGNIEEALESVTESVPAMIAVIAENMSRNPGFTEEAVRHYLGEEAAAVYGFIKSLPVATPGGVARSGSRVREGLKRWSDRFRQLNK